MSLKSLAWLPSPTLKRNGSAFGFNPLQHWLQDAKTISGCFYTMNPSIPDKGEISRARRTQFGNNQKGLVIDGKIRGDGGAYVYEFEEVAKERVAKLFFGGLKQATGLSKASLAIFECVYHQMQENPNSDRVQMSYYRASQQNPALNDRTYQRGLPRAFAKGISLSEPGGRHFFRQYQVNVQRRSSGFRQGLSSQGCGQATYPSPFPEDVAKLDPPQTQNN